MSAEKHERAAISLGAGDAGVHLGRGNMLANAGYLRRALEEMKLAHDLAPASAPAALNLAIANLLLGRDSDALRSAKVAADLGWDVHSLSFVYEEEALRAGRYAAATSAALANLSPANPDQHRTAEVVRLVCGAMADPGHKAAALATRLRLYPAGLSQAAGGRSIPDARPCLQSGFLYAQLGELDVAYDMVNQCLDSAAPGAFIQGPLPRMWTQEMRPFRQDPRFEALAARLGLLEYWKKYGPPDACDLKAEKLACH